MTRGADIANGQHGYRPEINGLRAIAVLAVMAYHAGVPGAGGGFLGVDVFFVISGYLITRILAGDHAAGRLSFRRFYERRLRRILPALYLVMAACLPFALYTMMPDALRSFGSSLAASALFSANIYFWAKTGGYFDAPSESMPLLHLWSLAVEEQFYLVYPLLLLLIWRLRPAWLMPILALLAGGSLAAGALAGLYSPSAGFFMLPSRMWQLLAGGLVAAWQVGGRAGPGPAVAAAGSWIGVALVAAALIWGERLLALPGLAGLPAVLGAGLLIACARADAGAGRLLAVRPLVAVGLVSYSAYLWHQPVLVFARALGAVDRLPPVATAGALVTTLLLAWASWRWVERPFRTGTLSWPAFAKLSAAIATAFVAIGAVFWVTSGLPQRFSAASLDLLRLQAEQRARIQRCMTTAAQPLPGDPACLRGRKGPIRMAFVGDSHAAAIAPAFDALLDRRGARGLVATVSACAPVLKDILAVPERDGCTDLHVRTLAYLAAHPEIETVVLAARWPYYLERDGFDNGEGGFDSIPTPPLNRARRAAIADAFADMPRRLLAMGRRVVLVYPTPEAGWMVPLQMVRRQRSATAWGELTVPHAAVARRSALSVAALDRVDDHPNLIRLYPERHLCSLQGGSRCRVELAGQALYSDAHHLTDAGARYALSGIADGRDADTLLPARLTGR